MKFYKQLSSIVVGISLLSTPVFAQTPEEKGLAIAEERKARDLGWGDSISQAEMILRNAQGQETIRKMRLKSLEVENDGDKALTIFDQPLDVKGTAFLSFSHATTPDDQWMYLPALKRVKRIASRNKSGPFMGSEFAFEDLSSFEVEKYSYQYLRDELFNGEDTFVVESDPVDKYSGYTKQVNWIDKAHYRPLKIEFYDRKGSLLKTLTFSDYKLYLDKYWRADKMSMVNNQTGKSTDFITKELIFKTGLKDKDFNKATLKRAK
ncbi:outer membrane lipoprotein-sorting protein [Pseudoalteromonas sp. S201]|uniref:outer membrane lipoprotein-sorting protein n=1 Tax=Pseudoalteromonas sp. S201 TaxID=579519 RepID=UPI00110D08EB|nr:outer membrane lipoprotein-sorting protein [Pseudoalteromonas sp. S201]TMS92771.1 outer membrane lipoprotein-sorting protein [Pseudoalteromonas sp. S201]